MRYIDYGPSPKEDMQESLFNDYILASSEYMGAWTVRELLNSIDLYGCDFSQLTDFCYFKRGVVHSTWCICITMRPTDAKRLYYIIERMKKQKGWKWDVDFMEADDMWRWEL